MKSIRGFVDFVREQGVVGLAVGFILGGSISKVISAFVSDIINPFLGIILGAAGNIQESVLFIGPAKVAWGDFLINVINFLILALVVYVFVRTLGLDRLDRKKL